MLLGFYAVSSRAVLFYSTGNVNYNTSPPGGALADSGWQYQGMFRLFLATPIAPHHFITAQHFGGSTGDTFYFEGQSYDIIARITDSASDLVLYEVDGTFPFYAPLYNNSDELNKAFVVFGRGTQRGAEVLANGDLKGWRWGSYDGIMRWGENTVDATPAVNGFSTLEADFDSTGGTGANECMLSDRDSGGGWFIQDGGEWKLAAVTYAISPATFSYSSSGTSPFNAALFDYSFRRSDAEKIYYSNGTSSWPYLSSSGNDPCRFFGTRISSRYSWITNNIPDFDRDVDGLPDWWEIEHAGDPVAMERDADPDGDTFTNYDEWLSDTVPTDGGSYLRMSGYTVAGQVVFESSTRRSYRVEFLADLADTDQMWEVEEDWFVPASTQTAVSVSSSTPGGFYRLRVKVR
jgi:hypothetical protein